MRLRFKLRHDISKDLLICRSDSADKSSRDVRWQGAGGQNEESPKLLSNPAGSARRLVRGHPDELPHADATSENAPRPWRGSLECGADQRGICDVDTSRKACSIRQPDQELSRPARRTNAGA